MRDNRSSPNSESQTSRSDAHRHGNLPVFGPTNRSRILNRIPCPVTTATIVTLDDHLGSRFKPTPPRPRFSSVPVRHHTQRSPAPLFVRVRSTHNPFRGEPLPHRGPTQLRSLSSGSTIRRCFIPPLGRPLKCVIRLIPRKPPACGSESPEPNPQAPTWLARPCVATSSAEVRRT